MADVKTFFTEEDKSDILSSIAAAETRTSGRIVVRVERRCGKDPVQKARDAFEFLKLRSAEKKNNVIFYISVEDRKFAILGDDGIDKKVPIDFWEKVKGAVITKFKQQQFAIGLAGGINLVGEKLVHYFPEEKQAGAAAPDGISYEE